MAAREEYPRPGFQRENWQNLNGEWEFYMDAGASGKQRKVYLEEKFEGKINLPFCPESKLSGVGHLDFMTSVWYGKNLSLSRAQLGGRVILHVGACDYETTVYVNGREAGLHTGGFTSFEFDITRFLAEGDNRLVIHAYDDVRSRRQPRGKQCECYDSRGCDYTRTTGIWQTVWLEFVPRVYLRRVTVDATDLGGRVLFTPELSEYLPSAALQIAVFFEGRKVAEKTFGLCGKESTVALDVPDVRLWAPGKPNLYDVTYTLTAEGEKADEVRGYFGIRRIDISGKKILINGEPVFQRLILDQGYYPDSLMTAPSDEALKADIDLAMRAGFNGARAHQKVFEERWLYHADRAGYLVWGEYGCWGLRTGRADALVEFLPQWLEAVERDRNHACIVAWCPFNEMWEKDGVPGVITSVYLATKAADGTRPVLDTSGGYHAGIGQKNNDIYSREENVRGTALTDIYDVHDYEQDPAKLKERYDRHAAGDYFVFFPEDALYDGEIPYIVSEYGGIKWNGGQFENDEKSWGYGESPRTQEELCERYCALTGVLLENPAIAGFCYTQLTDIEQEQNGLYYYDRTKKFSEDVYRRMREATAAPAAIERENKA